MKYLTNVLQQAVKSTLVHFSYILPPQFKWNAPNNQTYIDTYSTLTLALLKIGHVRNAANFPWLAELPVKNMIFTHWCDLCMLNKI